MLYPLSWVLRETFGLGVTEYWVGFTFFYAAHFINDPHFAVTYVLFYEDARERAFGDRFAPLQRLRYVLAGIVAPLVLAGWALYAVLGGSAPALGWMIQLMFLLVGWHYVKQGFGVMSVLSARRGVRYSPGERAAILAHCYAGWAYAWATPFEPGRELVEKGVVYAAVRHPTWLEPVTLVALVASTLWMIVVLVKKWRREGRLPVLTPLTGCSARCGPGRSSAASTRSFATRSPRCTGCSTCSSSGSSSATKPASARARRTSRPAPARASRSSRWLRSGSASSSSTRRPTCSTVCTRRTSAPRAHSTSARHRALAALYVFVNLHHYVMDSVIWRRDNPATRYLMAA